MISAKKFWQLDSQSRLRKLWRIAVDWETQLRASQATSQDIDLICQFMGQIICHPDWPELVIDQNDRVYLEYCLQGALAKDRDFLAVLRAVNDFGHYLAKLVGKEAAEWDLRPPINPVPKHSEIKPDISQKLENPNLPIRVVYCDSLRSPFNLGSIIRTAAAFAFDAVVLSPECPQIDHPRLSRSAMGSIDWISVLSLDFEETLSFFKLPVFGLELGGTPMEDFAFPRRAIAVLGSEELGIRPNILESCRQSAGLATITLPGFKASLNVGVSFGILAAAWQV